MAEEKSSPSGLTEAQAKEFHGLFMTSFLVWLAVSVVAHILVWMWRPWFPGFNQTSMVDTAQSVVSMLS
ncbi:MAG: light-harvesting antenna LH1, beta subunit [Myxococcales bacterium]|jgi:light-harvesting complex 1 beta chain|nr:light-harvesting antenna LH1, beta subunit [Myxococcales bacterium]